MFCLGFFLMTKVVLIAWKWMVQKKKNKPLEVFKRFLNGTWCMPRYGRKCFLVMSGFQETFLLKEVVTGKPEVTQSTQSPCFSFPLQCNGLALHKDRYFGNHSAMVSSLASAILTQKAPPGEVLLLTYHSVWKLTTSKHTLILNFKSYIFKTNPVSS